ALTPDGKGLVTSTFDPMTENPKVVLWDMATGRQRRRFEIKVQEDDPSPGVGGLVFSPDGKFLAAPVFEGLTAGGAHCCGVRLWAVGTGRGARRSGGPLPGEDFPPGVPYPAFSPDGQVIARAAPDGTIRLHGTADGKEKRSLGAAGQDEVSGLVF